MQNDKFIKEILQIKSLIERGDSHFFDQNLFLKSFLSDGSSTPANLSAMDYIEYDFFFDSETNEKCCGLKVKNKNISISDVFFQAVEDNESVLAYIMNKFPELTIQEIEAVLRVVTIILSGLDYDFEIENDI